MKCKNCQQQQESVRPNESGQDYEHHCDHCGWPLSDTDIRYNMKHAKSP